MIPEHTPVPEDTEKQQINQENTEEKTKHPTAEVPEESEKEINWKAFREARKKDRAEREAAERRAADKEAEAAALRQAMEAAFSRSPIGFSQPQYPNNEFQEESEDERIEKKVKALLDQREAQAAREREERETREFPNRIMQTYPDFNSIVTEENLDYLEYHYPEMMRPFKRLPDGFDKWSDLYNAVKKFIPNAQQVKKDSMKAEMNQMKPKSISSPGISPSGDGSRESWQSIEARRKARYLEMQKIMRGV